MEGVVGKKKKIRTHHRLWGGQRKSVLMYTRGEGVPKISVGFLSTSWKNQVKQ